MKILIKSIKGKMKFCERGFWNFLNFWELGKVLGEKISLENFGDT